jgi:hypothetical protein
MAIRPLNRVPIPVVGESAYGYVRRFAACLGYEKLDAFRHAVQLREFGPTSELARWERLAGLAGFPIEQLLHMRWRDPDAETARGVVTFLGQRFRSSHLSLARMRFCPVCLHEDGAPEQRILRDHWAMFMAPVCVKHGTLLVDTCDHCGDPFEYRRKTGIWNCGCGKDMADVATHPASRAACGITMALQSRTGLMRATGHINLSKDGILPKILEGASLNDLASIVDRIGVIAATPADQDEPVADDKLKYNAGTIDQERTIAECARQIEYANPILRDWPAGFERLIADVAGRNPAPTTQHKVRGLFATKMGRLLLDPLRGVDGKPIGLLDRVLRDWLRREHGYRWGQRIDVPKEALQQAEHERAERSSPQGKLRARVGKLVEDDAFMQASKLRALIAELWPAATPCSPTDQPGIRNRKVVTTYDGRSFPKNLFSTRDALRVMEDLYGPSSTLTETGCLER